METWRKLLREAFEDSGDDFAKMVTTLSDEELDKEFDDSYGGTEGEPFTAWGEKYVYFPVCYDGSEWVSWAPRNPCGEKMSHKGCG